MLGLALALSAASGPSTEVGVGLNSVSVFPVLQLEVGHRFAGGTRMSARGGTGILAHLGELGVEVPIAQLEAKLWLEARGTTRFRAYDNQASGYTPFGLFADVGLALRYTDPGLELGYAVEAGPWFGAVPASSCSNGICLDAYFEQEVVSWWVRPELWIHISISERWAFRARAGVAWYAHPPVLEDLAWLPEVELGLRWTL